MSETCFKDFVRLGDSETLDLIFPRWKNPGGVEQSDHLYHGWSTGAPM